MKKLLLSFVACVCAMMASADAITSSPSPAVTTKALEVTITCNDMGSTVYCYTWCASVDGVEVTPFTWDGVHTSKFQMSGSGGTYTLKIDDIQSFYGLSDAQLAGLTKLGFIAKTTSGAQTTDLFVDVVQGRKNAYSGGEGTEANPFVLKTVEDLDELAATSMDWEADCYLVLGADIDYQNGYYYGIGSKGSPFKGHFDGAGYSIKNIKLGIPEGLLAGVSRAGNASGLFNAIEGAVITRLGVVNAEVTEETWAGALVGYAASGSISRCFTTGKVNGSTICIGGLVGENNGATISDCYSACDVEAGGYAIGGVVGKNVGTIKNVYASGTVFGANYAGGVVGANYGVVSNSVALNAAVNTTIYDAANFVARFGGNNNSENKSTDNLGWSEMSHSSSTSQWTEYGDHATATSRSSLVSQSTYQTTLGWDFENVWEWRTESGKSYAALRGLNNQTNPNPDALYDTSGIEEIIAGDTKAYSVYPNPTTDVLNVSLGETIASCALYNLGGALALEADVDTGANELTLSLGGLESGVYMLQVVTADGDVIINKVIKK